MGDDESHEKIREEALTEKAYDREGRPMPEAKPKTEPKTKS